MVRRLAFSLVLLAFAAPSWAATCPLTSSRILLQNVVSEPRQMVQLANGHFILADTDNNRLVELAEDGAIVTTYGPSIPGHDTWSQPAGVAVDLVGRIYVADELNHRILKFDSSLAPIAEWGTFGTGPGELQQPFNLALSPDGTVLYVCELTGRRVSMFTIDGGFLGSWGTLGAGPGQFSAPSGIATDATGKVYVSDVPNQRIQVFSSTGTYLSQIAFGGPVAPHGIAIDDSGNLYVGYQNEIRVLNPSGTILCSFGDGYGDDWAYPARDGSIFVDNVTDHDLEQWVGSVVPTRNRTWGRLKSLYR